MTTVAGAVADRGVDQAAEAGRTTPVTRAVVRADRTTPGVPARPGARAATTPAVPARQAAPAATSRAEARAGRDPGAMTARGAAPGTMAEAGPGSL